MESEPIKRISERTRPAKSPDLPFKALVANKAISKKEK